MPKKDEWLTFAELAERLRVSHRTLYRWKAAGLLVPYGARRVRRYRWSDVLSALRRSPQVFNDVLN